MFGWRSCSGRLAFGLGRRPNASVTTWAQVARFSDIDRPATMRRRICCQKDGNDSNLSTVSGRPIRALSPKSSEFDASPRGEQMADATRNLEVAQPKQYQASQSTWDKIAESREFQDLMATKKTFIVPAFIFFVVYYFALPVLVGYAPQFMSIKVGFVNLAYLFALSQFFVAWIIAGLYVRAANNFDRLAEDILNKAEDAKGGK
jgi:uncharacterized membrane protein (DUF485 family)